MSASGAKKRIAIYSLPIIALVLLLVITNNVSPADIGPLGIFGFFILIYLFWLGIMYIMLSLFIYLRQRFGKKNQQFDEKKAYYVASIAAFLPVMLLGMQSVGQLDVKDFLLASFFVTLAIFYVLKRTS